MWTKLKNVVHLGWARFTEELKPVRTVLLMLVAFAVGVAFCWGIRLSPETIVRCHERYQELVVKSGMSLTDKDSTCINYYKRNSRIYKKGETLK